MTRGVVALALGLSLSGVAVHAHHSIFGVYDTGKRVTIDGVVTQFRFVNPHPSLTLEVRDGSGKTQLWQLEMDNRSELSAVGVTIDTFRPGDRIVVIGSPARQQPYGLYVQKLDRPADGFQLEQVGNSPRIRASSK